MDVIIITNALLGNYNDVSEAIEKEIQSEEKKAGRINEPFLNKLSVADLRSLCLELSAKNIEAEKKTEDQTYELNELYLKYDKMAAAYGEMSHFVKKASDVHLWHFEEEDDV